MVNGTLARLLSGFASLVLIVSTGLAQGQESFMVAGPILAFSDGTTNDDGSVPQPVGYTFTATVRYDPSATSASGEATRTTGEAMFDAAITQIEYAIFDREGLEIHRMIADGSLPYPQTLSSYILARQAPAGSSGDELVYEASSFDGSIGGQARILFSSSDGSLIDDIAAVPESPNQGDFDSTAVEFVSLAFDSGSTALPVLVIASGTIEIVDSGEADPYQACAEQARNHGQYVSCSARVSNLLRATGDISGKEKGQRQRTAARKK